MAGLFKPQPLSPQTGGEDSDSGWSVEDGVENGVESPSGTGELQCTGQSGRGNGMRLPVVDQYTSWLQRETSPDLH